MIKKIKDSVIEGKMITKAEALQIADSPIEELCSAADEIRKHFCSNNFDICTIINAKSGKCSENCKYCAQSSVYCANVEEYPLLDAEPILKSAKYNANHGIKRFSLVTSGKRLSNPEVDKVCEIVEEIRNSCDISVCASLGLLNLEQFEKLKLAGVSRIHNNLETSRRYFPSVCTTHTYNDKINAVKAAQSTGLSVCSGGIIGLGETMEDRIDMALELRDLNIRSIPVNILNPIKGTPYESNKRLTNDEIRCVCAIFRFINPTASIRLAGGRILLDDRGESCFKAGANAAISGNMLTTEGAGVETDNKMLNKLGFKAVLWNG